MPIKIIRRTLEYRGEARDVDHQVSVSTVGSTWKRFANVDVKEVDRQVMPTPAAPAKPVPKGERVPLTLQGVQLVCQGRGCKNDDPLMFRATFQVTHPEPMRLLSFMCTKCWREHPQ